MRRILLVAALLALAAPASAQYGGYYRDGYGGGYDRYDGRPRSWDGRRGYDEYEDDDRPRRDRWRRSDPYTDRGPAGPPAYARRPGSGICATPQGSCRVAQGVAAGTPCGCSTGGFTSRGRVQ